MATQTCRVVTNVFKKYPSPPAFSTTSLHGLTPKRPLLRQKQLLTCRFDSLPSGSSVVVRAEQEFDIEKALAKATEKFEAAENKPVVIGYGVGALVALLVTEWLIHLPGLDFLVGVLVSPLLVIRYVLDKKDWYADAEEAVDRVASLLPGLKK